jgi:tryptophan synthase alpha chain
MADGGARLHAAFDQHGYPIFIPYVMAGYPTLPDSRRYAAALAEHAGVLEIGMPYSDPLADGPTIQAAGQTALKAGTRIQDVFDMAAALAGGPPIAMMTYYNTLLATGVEAFVERAATAQIAGLIVPDLPVDEARELRAIANDAGIAVVALAAPTTTDARLDEIGREAGGFVYAVAVAGVTGGSTVLDAGLKGFLARAKAHIAAPIAVGFGIRTPSQAAAMGGEADGVVIASELIRIIDNAASADAAVNELARFSKDVVDAITGAATAAER